MFIWLETYSFLKNHIEPTLDKSLRSKYLQMLFLFEKYYNSALINFYIQQSTIELEQSKYKKEKLIDFLIANEDLYNNQIKTVHFFTINDKKIEGEYIIECLQKIELKFPLYEHSNTIEFFLKFEKIFEPFFSILWDFTSEKFYLEYGEEEEITLARTVYLARKHNIMIPDMIES